MAFRRLSVLTASLRMQLVTVSIILTVLAVSATTLVGLHRLNQKIAEDIEIRTLSSLRVAARITNERIPIFQIEPNAAGEPEIMKVMTSASLIDSMSAHELTQIVDAISEINKGTATIFRWNEEKKDFVRVATTVKKPDGTRAVGTVLGQNGIVYPYMMRKQAYRGVAQILGEPYQTGYLPMIDTAGKPVGVLYIGIGKMSELAAVSTGFIRDVLIGSAFVLASAALLFLFATGRLLRPLDRVAAATNALASGSRDVTVPHTERTDQIGLIAQAVEGFREAVVRQRELEAGQAEETRRIAERKAEMDRIVVQFREAFQANLGQLRQGAEKVRVTSGEIRAVVSQAGDRVAEGREASEAGASAISEVATATNQFASSITEIAARSNEAAAIVRHASETGHRAETVAGDLSAAVEKISAAVSVISSIAAQTNLLALNATIEAARAGEAGKGFAVVASEVKELSNGTSKAATEIAELVKSIEGVTQAVTGATREIGEGLTSINETTLVIASAVTEQEQVTRDIASNADSAAQRGDIIRSGFGEVQKAIEETAAAADALDNLSKEFATSSDVLVNEIEQFLARMAA
jgi:methyl-accepting chemotaxis protein